MWRENPTWCQQIIAAQLAKLGYQISPRTVAKYRRSNLDRQRGQRWTTFIRNHLHETWACDFFVLVTGRFRVLYVFVVLSLGRRTIVHAGVTEHPSASRRPPAMPSKSPDSSSTTETRSTAPTSSAASADSAPDSSPLHLARQRPIPSASG